MASFDYQAEDWHPSLVMVVTAERGKKKKNTARNQAHLTPNMRRLHMQGRSKAQPRKTRKEKQLAMKPENGKKTR